MIATDPAQRADLSRLPINYSLLTVESVIGYLVGRARYPHHMDDLEIDTVLHAKLAGPDGQLKDIAFRPARFHYS